MARRQEKYPDTNIFKYHNQNPHNKITGDCVVRAISFALDIPYNDVVMEIAKFQCKTGYQVNYHREGAFLKKVYGIEQCKQLKHYDNTKYTLKEFIEEKPKGVYLVLLPHHMTVIKNGVNYDIWDCTKSTRKTGVYWKIK